MNIKALEPIRADEFSNLIWLIVHTSQEIDGLGETSALNFLEECD